MLKTTNVLLHSFAIVCTYYLVVVTCSPIVNQTASQQSLNSPSFDANSPNPTDVSNLRLVPELRAAKLRWSVEHEASNEPRAFLIRYCELTSWQHEIKCRFREANIVNYEHPSPHNDVTEDDNDEQVSTMAAHQTAVISKPKTVKPNIQTQTSQSHPNNTNTKWSVRKITTTTTTNYNSSLISNNEIDYDTSKNRLESSQLPVKLKSDYESQIYDLRALTNYTFAVQVLRYERDSENRRLSMAPIASSSSGGIRLLGRGHLARRLDLGSLVEQQQQQSKAVIETKSFKADANRCLADVSEVQVSTGPFFGGKISVENSTDARCQLVGNKSSEQSSYLFKIDHELCKSKVVDGNRIETMILVHENRDILTHNSARFLVVCNFMQKSFTMRASVSLPRVNSPASNSNSNFNGQHATARHSHPAIVTSLSNGRPTLLHNNNNQEYHSVRLGSIPGIYKPSMSRQNELDTGDSSLPPKISVQRAPSRARSMAHLAASGEPPQPGMLANLSLPVPGPVQVQSELLFVASKLRPSSASLPLSATSATTSGVTDPGQELGVLPSLDLEALQSGQSKAVTHTMGRMGRSDFDEHADDIENFSEPPVVMSNNHHGDRKSRLSQPEQSSADKPSGSTSTAMPPPILSRMGKSLDMARQVQTTNTTTTASATSSTSRDQDEQEVNHPTTRQQLLKLLVAVLTEMDRRNLEMPDFLMSSPEVDDGIQVKPSGSTSTAMLPPILSRIVKTLYMPRQVQTTNTTTTASATSSTSRDQDEQEVDHPITRQQMVKSFVAVLTEMARRNLEMPDFLMSSPEVDDSVQVKPASVVEPTPKSHVRNAKASVRIVDGFVLNNKRTNNHTNVDATTTTPSITSTSTSTTTTSTSTTTTAGPPTRIDYARNLKHDHHESGKLLNSNLDMDTSARQSNLLLSWPVCGLWMACLAMGLVVSLMWFVWLPSMMPSEARGSVAFDAPNVVGHVNRGFVAPAMAKPQPPAPAAPAPVAGRLAMSEADARPLRLAPDKGDYNRLLEHQACVSSPSTGSTVTLVASEEGHGNGHGHGHNEMCKQSELLYSEHVLLEANHSSLGESYA